MSKFFDNERNGTERKKKKRKTINGISRTKKNVFARGAEWWWCRGTDSFLQRNENERRHDDDDDDDEEKDGFDAFVVGVDVRVRLCSSGAFEALVALGDDAGGFGALRRGVSSTLNAG